jgi:outer membrane protein TolC
MPKSPPVLRFAGVFMAQIAMWVAAPAFAGEALALTLEDAVQRGLENNLAALTSRDGVRQAEGARDLARSARLPLISAGLSGSRQVIDLEAYGFPPPPGGSPLVGPFNVFDARLYLSQSLLDLEAVDRSRAGSSGVDAARFAAEDAREAVVLGCASLYLRAAADAKRIDAVREQVAVATSLHERAIRLKDAGVVAGLEVLRAKVELESERQRLIVAENDFAKDKLALARAIGLPLEQPFELAESLSYKPSPPVDLDSALQDAYAARADLKQAEAALAAAEATRDADKRQRVPTLHLNADFGLIGPSAPRLETTYMVGLGLRFPLFEGGRIGAHVLQDDAEVSRRRAYLADLRAGVDLDVRSALLDLGAADQRVRVAQGALELAGEQLRQSDDRFAAGVAGNLEVVQAQNALASASDAYLGALYAHNLARLALARARGEAERLLPTFLSVEGDPSHG